MAGFRGYAHRLAGFWGYAHSSGRISRICIPQPVHILEILPATHRAKLHGAREGVSVWTMSGWRHREKVEGGNRRPRRAQTETAKGNAGRSPGRWRRWKAAGRHLAHLRLDIARKRQRGCQHGRAFGRSGEGGKHRVGSKYVCSWRLRVVRGRSDGRFGKIGQRFEAKAPERGGTARPRKQAGARTETHLRIMDECEAASARARKGADAWIR